MFVIAVASVWLFAASGMPWSWIVVFTGLSAFPGIPAFSIWITERRWARRLAALGTNLQPRLLTLSLAGGAVLVLQGIIGATLGTWPATALAPLAYVLEFLIARERIGSPKADTDKV
ncbi:hypothetical protein [Promicromonospora umidemergens]|nr:hypothetical protein [Promicromonospora umidemergens]